MESRIAEGSLNVFRAPVVGSRQGKIVLVDVFSELEDSARYTVKKYTSSKCQGDDDHWEHERIRLVPLNPEFEPFDLREGSFRVLAEWLRGLD